ncbi:Uncharacterized Nudix hydrolase YfcD [Galdieria sulphuraria]|nr:Uncharacterized Nudix hydrolase YfcD [Galdieria sulphuraria]
MCTPNNDVGCMSNDEKVLLVDLDNNILGSCLRKEMRAQNLPHRASYILVFSSDDRIVVQKRTKHKDYCPGYYEVTAELGIHSPLKHCFFFLLPR